MEQHAQDEPIQKITLRCDCEDDARFFAEDDPTLRIARLRGAHIERNGTEITMTSGVARKNLQEVLGHEELGFLFTHPMLENPDSMEIH